MKRKRGRYNVKQDLSQRNKIGTNKSTEKKSVPIREDR